MKNFLTYIFLALIFITPGFVHSATFGVGETYSVFRGQIVEDDLYALGGSVSIVGEILSDALIAGGNIFVGDLISEDAFLVGGTVDMIGNVGKNLRIISGRTVIQGKVGKDIAIVSGDISVLPNSEVLGSLYVAGGDTVIDGEIKGDIRGVLGNLTLNGVVSGDVHITADSVTLGPKAVINGDFYYSSSKSALVDPGAQILGKTDFTQITTRSKIERFIPTLWGAWIFIKFFVLLMSALVIHGVFKSISNTLVENALSRPWKSILRGFLFTVAIPFAILLVLLTFIGIPFMVLGFSIYVSFMVLAYLFSPIVVGGYLFKLFYKTDNVLITWKSIALGVLSVMFLGMLGWIGSVLQILLFLLTLGSIYYVLIERFIRARE